MANESQRTLQDLIRRPSQTIVVVDLVESVRLMDIDEGAVIQRWRLLVRHAGDWLAHSGRGRLVKSLGDGMLIELEATRPAVELAFFLHARLDECNPGRNDDAQLKLRIGIHVADVMVDALDIYGKGVNLAARLASLAEPGQTILSVEARDLVVAGVDARLVDLGDCWLKHVPRAVRAFRAEPVGEACASASLVPLALPEDMLPVLAMFSLRPVEDREPAALFGRLAADQVAALLSSSRTLRVISRRSTDAVAWTPGSNSRVFELLGNHFAVGGTVAVQADRTQVRLELHDASGQMLWTSGRSVANEELLAGSGAALAELAESIAQQLSIETMRKVRTMPFPSIEGYALLLGAVGLLHCSAPRDFDRAGPALAALAERLPRHPSAHAWLAMWHAFRVIRGVSDKVDDERRRAEGAVEAAIRRDPRSSLAWSMSGLVRGFLSKDLDGADAAYEQAIHLNPSEPFAWLFTATLRAWQGEGDQAASAATRALSLTPLDPLRYYFESLAAAGFLADRRYPEAISLCHRSLQLNRMHTPTLRVLAIAQVMEGSVAAARATVEELRGREPALTVTSYLARYPGGDTERAREYGRALAEAGLPLH